jgi:hypothetical protein
MNQNSQGNLKRQGITCQSKQADTNTGKLIQYSNELK